MKRRGVTLIELLIAISIIGILSGLALGAYQKASTRAKVIKTQSTIAKLHQQVMTKWESYKFRRLTVEPKQLLQSGGSAYISARISEMVARRAPQFAGSSAPDPLTVPMSSAQLAAVKLLAMRELQRYEMPTGWTDIVDTDQAGNWQGSPGSWNMRPPQVLLVPPQLAVAYLARLNSAKDSQGNFPTQQQLQTFDAAETLYFVVKFASEDESNTLLDDVKQVGDADADGLPEFQDAFAGMQSGFPAAAPNNNPIFWNRWPAGFTNLNRGDGSANNILLESLHVSDFQDDPNNLVLDKVLTPGQPPVQSVVQDPATFSEDNHDYFDPLRLDVPSATSGPRGYQLTPLIISAGIDSTFGLSWTAWNDPSYTVANQNILVNDPYAVDSQNRRNADWGYTVPQPATGTADNITSHTLTTR